jgi:hypothetical protein
MEFYDPILKDVSRFLSCLLIKKAYMTETFYVQKINMRLWTRVQ